MIFPNWSVAAVSIGTLSAICEISMDLNLTRQGRRCPCLFRSTADRQITPTYRQKFGAPKSADTDKKSERLATKIHFGYHKVSKL